MSSRPVGPCINCSLRQVGCHSTCEKYISYKTELDEWNREYRKRHEAEYDDVYETNRQRKWRRWKKWLK